VSRRAPFLVTLHACGATQEHAYAWDATGQLLVVEASDWDFPVSGPVETAVVEVFVGGRKTIEMRVAGADYLRLAETDAVTDLLVGLERMPPREALDYALTMARLALA